MKVRNIILLFALLSIQIVVFGQDKEKAKAKEESVSLVKWYTFKEAVALQEKQPKTIFIDMYTDWCGWCKKMDKETFHNPQIAAYLNANFYPVKFNAERKDSIVYRGKTYYNKGTGKRPPHELAVELLKGHMSYPTIVYIDDQFNVNPVSGFMDPAKIEPVLIYFAERIHRSAPFADFKKNFESYYIKKQKPEKLVNWVSFNDAIALNNTNPKKILVVIYSDFSRGSELFVNTTFADSSIAAYVNEKYYCVKLRAEMTDTITIGNQVFVNEMKTTNYPHQLPIALLQGKMSYPSVLFLNEKSQIINKISGYLIPKGLEPFIKYFGDDFYKTQQWDEFRKNFISEIK